MTQIIANLFMRFCRKSIFSVSHKNIGKLALIFFLIQIVNIFSLFAINKETLVSLVDTNRVLAEPIELHLTSEDSPFTNSSVSLNHEDAWLFFDNIKPSVVIDSFISHILINGVPLNNGTNSRVAIYSHGTVVMPYGNTFKPLTVYSEENYTGDSMQLAIHTYYNDLGNFNNVIKSIKLKRGYMVTFASNADGSGYSRVFIADNEDLELDVMPKELNGTVSFIRVFKHQWVSKKGKAGWDPHDINATSYYDWNIGGNSSNDVEYIAIRQNAGWPSWDDINSKQNISHLLGFNEPDQTNQANMTVQEMLDQWPYMMQSGLRIGSPAWASPWNNIGGNLFDFINQCEELNYRVDFVALHCYWGGKTPINWYNDLKYLHEATGRPLWITEWNNGANWTGEWWPDSDRSYTEANALKQLNDITGILQVMDTASFIERYFIYDWVQDCRAMVLGDTLTLAGKYYAANPSEIAFNSKNEVIPQWNFSLPSLSCQYLRLSDVVRLDWANPNGDLCTNYIIEKKINGGGYDTLYSGDDMDVAYYADPVNAEMEGTNTYKISLFDFNGGKLVSNEALFHQVAGSDSIKAGRFMINNSEWASALFNDQFSVAPLVFLGIPSYNNLYPMTQRVSNIKSNTFKFHLDPWAYLNNPALTNTDVLSVLALPEGRYCFGGLTAEAKKAGSISRDWATVGFTDTFATAPVVFCTIISNTNSIPLTVAIRNITASGFELCLKSEEAITDYLFPETINYFAIETGQGKIMDKRVTVGKSSEGNGIGLAPVEIEYPSTYSEPVVFAGLLTSADNFASTLRYKAMEGSTLEIIKKREISATVTASKEDQFGWMIMDMAAGQDTITKVLEDVSVSPLNFYPNPATDVIYFNFNKPTSIAIYDITGKKQLETRVLNSIDIRTLPAGVYIIRGEGCLPAMFIKKH
ncbi:MAG: T9SS type A sorting domain-containing protein [Bacteroidales bacterium]|nr:T9SS type A sorting domain-containing protein [Bacteroidales bacterium]